MPEEQALHSSPLPLTILKTEPADVPTVAAEPSRLTAFAAVPQTEPEAPAEGLRAPETAAAPQPTPVSPPPVYVVYTVQDGDTISGLAAKYGISSSSIVWSNPGLESADSLTPGQYLRVPLSEGIIYDVQPGDTLSDIAARFGVDVQAIIGFPANNLASADTIAENQTIFIPGGTMPEPTPEPQPTPTPEPVATPAPQPVATPPSGDSSGAAARAVELARSRIGAPYVSGAAGPWGFDCSGLVYWVYSQLGLDIPRPAPDQYAWTTPVDRSAMQPGDLAFFTNTYPSSQWITHVGIYVGGGDVVMAVDEGDIVREVSLGEAYWSDHFAAAGRPPY
jgi:peptidoglycan endopeptidase LytE